MAVGLSVDAFSLAVIYGMNTISKKKALTLSILVGIFHIMMPTIGSIIGISIFRSLVSKANLLAGIVFLAIAFEMISSLKEEDKVLTLSKFYHLLFFAFTVSLDSFSVGIVLSLANENVILAGSIFSIVSFLFTYFGLTLGKIIHDKYNTKATITGAIILIILAIKYFLLA